MADGAERSRQHRERQKRGVTRFERLAFTPEIDKGLLDLGLVINGDYVAAAQAWLEAAPEIVKAMDAQNAVASVAYARAKEITENRNRPRNAVTRPRGARDSISHEDGVAIVQPNEATAREPR